MQADFAFFRFFTGFRPVSGPVPENHPSPEILRIRRSGRTRPPWPEPLPAGKDAAATGVTKKPPSGIPGGGIQFTSNPAHFMGALRSMFNPIALL